MTDTTMNFDMIPARKGLKRSRRARRGLTLLESTLVLGLILILVAAAYYAYSVVRTNQRNAALSGQVMRVVNTVETLYSSSASVDNGDLLPVLRTSGSFSDNEIFLDDGDTVMLNQWDTEIDVVGEGGRDFTITVNDVSASTCRSVSGAFIEGVRAPDAVTINGNATALTVANINTACNVAENDVALTF